MQISDKTLYTDAIYNAIKAEDKERIKELATSHLLGCNLWEIELGVLMQFINGDFSATKVDANAHVAGGMTIFVKLFFESIKTLHQHKIMMSDLPVVVVWRFHLAKTCFISQGRILVCTLLRTARKSKSQRY